MTGIYYVAIVLFVGMSVILCASILLQESKGAGGLGALAGGDAGDSLFGTSTPDVLRRFTGWLVFAFFVTCVVLSLWTAAFERAKVNGAAQWSVEELSGGQR
jgi:preprotein translocase subunit SecG